MLHGPQNVKLFLSFDFFCILLALRTVLFSSHYVPAIFKDICLIFPSYFVVYIPFQLVLFVFFRMKLLLINPCKKRKEKKENTCLNPEPSG